MPGEGAGPRIRRPPRATGAGPGRPSVSPLAWVAVTAWASSRAGTELALWAWRSGEQRPVAVGCVAVLGLAVAWCTVRRPIARWLSLAAACALGVALAHGVWLASVSATLDGAAPRAYSALVASDPREGPFGTSVVVRLEDVPGAPSVRVTWPEKATLPAYGQRAVVDTRLKACDPSGDFSADVFRSGEILSAKPWRVRIVGWAPWPLGEVCAWRQGSIAVARAAGGAGGEALASMLFGAPVQGEGVAALEDARTAGVAWAIAASGLHLGVIVLLVERMAAALGSGRRGRALAALVALAVVSAAAGMRLSLLRAALAAAAAVVARLVGRRRDPTAALGAALTLLVVADPSAAYDAGLLLGAAAVSAIALVSVLAKAWLAPVIGRRASQALGASVAAQAAVAPLSAGMFGAVSLAGPVTLAVSGVPVQAAVALGAAGAALRPVWDGGGTALMRAGAVAADVAASVWHLAAGVPGALLAVPAPEWWLPAAWAALGALLWLRWPTPRRAARVRAGMGIALAAAVAFSLLARPPLGCVQVLDIGQGDAILIRDGPHAVLVDTGPDPVVLRQALARAGVSELDGLVLTHAHEDHTGGLDGLAGVARPRWIGVPDVEDDSVDDLAKRAAGCTDQVVRLRGNMSFDVGRVRVRVLWPRGGDRGLEANDTSVILLLERDGRRAILLGDAEERAQRGALEVWSTPVDMVKVAHHGSVNGNVPEALESWRPALALISVGEGNKFGHPRAEALATLAGVGAAVRRTDLEGDLVWEPAALPQSAVAEAARLLCDNRVRGRPVAGLPSHGEQVPDPWLPQVSPISSRSTSSTVRRICSSNARRSGCATVWPRWPTSTSTWRPSTAPRPPPTTSSTPRTRCLS